MFGIGRRLKRRKKWTPPVHETLDRLMVLSGTTASRQQPVNARIRDLADVEFRVFSQWGEDGIIEWLVKHVPSPRSFVEFGVDTFHEANCRFLMLHRNWRGLVMDASEQNMAALRGEELFWRYDLLARPAFITAENIDSLLQEQGFAGPIGILSIDIDGNDYWVWRALKAVQPAIVICEYNPILGDTAPVVVPYDAGFTRLGAHYSGLYFGASIGALRALGTQLGYEFVGTNSNGINAFFVRRDLAGPVLALLENVRAYPSRHRNSFDPQGKLSFARAIERLELIRDLPVIDVVANRTLRLGEIERPYSAEWLAGMA